MNTDQISQLEALAKAIKNTDEGRGTVFEASDAEADAYANARPALAALIAEFEKAVGLLGEAAPMLASKWVTVEKCKAVADRIAAFLAANKQESA